MSRIEKGIDEVEDGLKNIFGGVKREAEKITDKAENLMDDVGERVEGKTEDLINRLNNRNRN